MNLESLTYAIVDSGGYNFIVPSGAPDGLPFNCWTLHEILTSSELSDDDVVYPRDQTWKTTVKELRRHHKIGLL